MSTRDTQIVGHLWRLWQQLDGATESELLTDEEVRDAIARVRHTHAAAAIRNCVEKIDAESVSIDSPYFRSLVADAEAWRRQQGLGFTPPPPRNGTDQEV